jgi:hypothetical protein
MINSNKIGNFDLDPSLASAAKALEQSQLQDKLNVRVSPNF